ncbi:dihydroxyacetone kinase [Ilyonectria destructans]|nr:dihydroxyacetone kinase [Ilyonectria destructans]
MSDKHFLHNPTQLVDTSLRATILNNPSLALDATNKIIYRRQRDSQGSHVSLVSGGGSGHEPSFGAMVGKGLLTASVAGTIFASPATQQILAAITGRVDNSQGVLVIVMNYTGDVLNFGVAVEKARSRGINVDMVVVGDDVGVGRAKTGKVGRRGIAGTVLIQKIASAMAAQGGSLQEVASVARLAAKNITSVGASLEHVHVPGRQATNGVSHGSGALGDQEVEVSFPTLVSKMLQQLLDLNDEDRAFLKIDSDAVLLVNNLGGVSILEMGGITAEVVKQLEATYNINPVRILTGTYTTSLNGLGFSITLLNLATGNKQGFNLLKLIDSPAEATGWAAPVTPENWALTWTGTPDVHEVEEHIVRPSGLQYDAFSAKKALTAGLNSIIVAEPEITRFDTIVGDGDCGTGMKRGAEAVLDGINRNPLTGDAVLDVAFILSKVEASMDGTSGALYTIFLNALLSYLVKHGPGVVNTKTWAEALKDSSVALSKYTPARVGDRTFIDALEPFIQALADSGNVLKAAKASRHGA